MATSWQGLAELKRRFANMPLGAKTELKAALAQSADTIVRAQKAAAPVRSGRLRDSITWTWGDAKDSRSGSSLVVIVSAGNAKAFYARYVEFGVSAHEAGGRFAGADIPPVAAQPFFYGPYRAQQRPTTNRIRAAFRKAVKAGA